MRETAIRVMAMSFCVSSRPGSGDVVLITKRPAYRFYSDDGRYASHVG